jgi:hypothetical protein
VGVLGCGSPLPRCLRQFPPLLLPYFLSVRSHKFCKRAAGATHARHARGSVCHHTLDARYFYTRPKIVVQNFKRPGQDLVTPWLRIEPRVRPRECLRAVERRANHGLQVNASRGSLLDDLSDDVGGVVRRGAIDPLSRSRKPMVRFLQG